jgi:hypothetical protein
MNGAQDIFFYKSNLEILFRKVLVFIRQRFGEKFYFLVSSSVKLAVGRDKKRYSQNFIIKDIHSLPTDNRKKILRLVLTHDIDSAKCAQTLHDIVQIEKYFGMRSSINVLTKSNYDVRSLQLENLQQNGFEIGLHGETHDIALGFRSDYEIRRALQSSLDVLREFKIVSFRAPGLSVSRRLHSILIDLGFTHDSSISHGPLYSKPFFNENILKSNDLGSKLVQAPLGLGDDILFRELLLDSSEAQNLFLSLAHDYVQHERTLVCNFHPGILSSRIDFYHDLLANLAKNFTVSSHLIREY